MIIIQNVSDICSLEPTKCSKPLRLYLRQLLEGIEDEVTIEEREEHLLRNPVILCEREDNILGLVEVSPFGHEYVEKLDLEPATFRIGILLDNDWIAQYIVQAHNLDHETMLWIIGQTGGADDAQ
jgi:hypothetical protein